ncbi:MAG TPA: DUF2332 domain-containing protein [Nocardioidaceae bacterium]|nr:DUF2332 domain-containing protein [Nocardioidaceae bacterium]
MSFETGTTLADRMRTHAGDAQHLYGHLMRAMADDWEAGGPVREICVDWEDAPPGSVVQLRLLAGVFRLALRGESPELEPYYPCLGGAAPPEEAWPTVRRVLAAHVSELRAALEVAPQTNEVGRSVALLVGLFAAVERTGLSDVRLLEVGASAGLNLLVDRFWIEGEGWSHGPDDSPVRMPHAVRGPVAVSRLAIVERRGCDLSPVDPGTEDGRLRLRSFVWPWQIERHARLAAALEVASRHPATVDRAGAGDWLEQQLQPDGDDTLTVVWQSVTEQYWPRAEVSRVDALVRAAAGRMPVARLAMEYPLEGEPPAGPSLFLAVGSGARQPIAEVEDHGGPVTVRL